MKVQHHINTNEGIGWYRCKSVQFGGDTATWELSRESRYSFFEAYQMIPHRQLIKASDDISLRAFVKAWGPLRLILNDWTGSDPIDLYRTERNKLLVIARLLASVERPEMQRPALFGFARVSKADLGFEMNLSALQAQFPIPLDTESGFEDGIQSWLDALTQQQIEFAATWLVSNIVPWIGFPRFTVERSKGNNTLGATPGINDLVNALHWMLWQDVAQGHPIQFCVECRGLIDFKTQHAKKFCSPECAHRKTAREWQKHKRDKERESNVTQKTR
jgi:hypothetical protein